MTAQNRPAVISVDVETDWGGRLPPDPANCRGITEGLPLILKALRESSSPATFFISGNVAGNFKDLVGEIRQAGHEVASHGYAHDLNYSTLTYQDLRYQLAKSKAVLEEIINGEVIGFRTPQFRFHPDLFKALGETGYRYDSSSINRGRFLTRYNYSGFPGGPFVAEDILEIPVSVLPVLRVPQGLLWMNAIGMTACRLLIRVGTQGAYDAFYLHPFDVIQKSRGPDFGLAVKIWYAFKSTKALATLKDLLAYWQEARRPLMTMKDFF